MSSSSHKHKWTFHHTCVFVDMPPYMCLCGYATIHVQSVGCRGRSLLVQLGIELLLNCWLPLNVDTNRKAVESSLRSLSATACIRAPLSRGRWIRSACCWLRRRSASGGTRSQHVKPGRTGRGDYCRCRGGCPQRFAADQRLCVGRQRLARR